MDCDTIVIGSGIGGLTAALALARAGQRVLVIEQHYLPGGWTHSFTLSGYTFSPGLHYVGELGAGRPLRRMLEGLGLGRRLQFWELNPDGYDHLLIGGERFDVPKGRDRWLAHLQDRFPAEKKALDRYFTISRAINDELMCCDELLTFPRVLTLPWRAPHLIRWGLRTLDALFDACDIRDPLLRAVLSARCGNHGLAPSRVSAPLHVSMIQHYHQGGYYPRGGARRLTSAFVKELRAHAGEIVLRTRVKQILVERNRAVGVEVENGERITARHVISNADAALTYERLLPEPYGRSHRRKARRTVPSISCLSLFAAVDADLRAMHYDSGNYWWFARDDVGRLYERMERSMEAAAEGVFVSVSSLKDPTSRRDGHHTLEMFTFLPYESFSRWRHTRLGERGDAYDSLKRSLTEKMLRAAEHVIPGLGEMLVFCELGTPLTNEHYCAARHGGCYGSAKTPWQVGPFSFSTRAPVRDLYLCGASTLSHGIGGASLSGLFAARSVLGLARAEECLGPADGSLKVMSADEARVERGPESAPPRSAVRPRTAAASVAIRGAR